MLSANTLRALSNVFIGDSNDLYSYKGGSDLVNFFNVNFDFEDNYYSGFPSRWAYVVDKFNQLLSEGKFDDFISLILSKQFIMKDKVLTDINAVAGIIKEHLNLEIMMEDYYENRRTFSETLERIPWE